MSCHPTAEGTGVFKGVMCALCLSVALLSVRLHGFHSPKQADFGARDHGSWSLRAYRFANVINPRETDFFLLALICKNPESRPRALP